MDEITIYIVLILISVPIGLSILAIVTGKFPVLGGVYKNLVVFGDKNVNPSLLKGLRARVLGITFGGLLTLFALSIYEYKDPVCSVSIVIGLMIGFFHYKWSLKQV